MPNLSRANFRAQLSAAPLKRLMARQVGKDFSYFRAQLSAAPLKLLKLPGIADEQFISALN
jgi:hypothetical protein